MSRALVHAPRLRARGVVPAPRFAEGGAGTTDSTRADRWSGPEPTTEEATVTTTAPERKTDADHPTQGPASGTPTDHGASTHASPRRRGPVTSIAVWSATHPWLALFAWLVVIASTFGVGVALETRAATTAELLTGESQRAQQLADEAGFHEAASELVLVTRADDAALASADTALDDLETMRAAIAATEHVAEVAGPLPSDDGTAALFVVSLSGDPNTAGDRVEPLRNEVAALASTHADYTLQQTGSVSIAQSIDDWIGADLDTAAAISIPATLLVLLLAFGAIVMGVLPVAVGAASVLSAMGLWAAASQLVPDQGLVPHVILLIGMAVGVDYALFSSRRFREERHAGRGALAATEAAARTAGHSILVSGTAVALSLAGLLLLGETLYSGVAIGGVLVVVVAMASSVTAMPALMRLLDRWIDRPRVPFVWRLTANVGTGGGGAADALRRVLRPVVRHPWVALGIAAAALGLMAAPVAGMKLTTTTLDDFPRTLPAFQAYDDVLAAFPDHTSSARVVLAADGDAEAVELAGVATSIADRAAADAAHFGDAAAPWTSSDGRTVVLDVPVTHVSTSDDARDALAALRDTIVPGALSRAGGDASGIEAAVGGDTAQTVDSIANLERTMPWVIAIVLALTFAFMLAVYRSIAIAAITVALNIASTLASFGLLTLIFQGSWAEGLLGFTSNGHLVSWVPLMLFVILSGLSLDYHVLVVSRIRELAREGRPIVEAVLEGLAKTAGVVTSAAAVMIVVFVVFGSLTFIEMKQIGVGLAIATLLDVTLIRLVALPAALLAVRRAVWWPGRMRAGAYR